MPSKLIHLAGRVFNTPLYITPEKLDIIMGFLLPRLTGQSLPEMKLDPEDSSVVISAAKSSPVARQDTGGGKYIAVINVFGTLVQRAGGLDAWSGLLSYDAIRSQFREVQKDPDVGGVLFRFDSNGGEGAGLFDLVDEIYAARGSMPIHAFVDERAFSAAYALASACDQVYLTRTAGVGSVGVIAQHQDQSKANEMKGVAMTAVFAGARKNDFTPHQPLTGDAQSALQQMVNDGYELFVKTVARDRNMSVEAVKKTEAALYWGEAAIKAGLADGIKTWDQAIAAITNEIRTGRKGGTSMSKAVLVNQLTALFKGDSPEIVAEALGDLGFVATTSTKSAAETEQAITAAKAEAVAGVKAEVAEVIGLCELGGVMDMLGPLLKSGATVDEARTQIVNAKAEAGVKTKVTSTVSSGAGGEVNYLMQDAQSRAATGR